MLSQKHSLDDEFEPHRKITTAENVDYLSYNFDEMDLAVSWRMSTKQKKNVANGIRLENASWRSWNKQRNHLKTVNPQTVNWLKDSDVTWLYGPLHTVIKDMNDDTHFNSLKHESHHKTPIPHESPKPLKSALKKLSRTDLLKRSTSELLNMSMFMEDSKQAEFSPEVIANHRQPKLRFNPYVEQCVALSDEEQIRVYNRNKRNSRLASKVYTDMVCDEEEEYEASDESSGEEEYGHSRLLSKGQHKSIRKIEPSLLKTTSVPDCEDEHDDTGYLSASFEHHYRTADHDQRSTSSTSSNTVDKTVDNNDYLDHFDNVIRDIKEQPFYRCESKEIGRLQSPSACQSLKAHATEQHISARPKIERSKSDAHAMGVMDNRSIHTKHTNDSIFSHIGHWLVGYIGHKKH